MKPIHLSLACALGLGMAFSAFAQNPLPAYQEEAPADVPDEPEADLTTTETLPPSEITDPAEAAELPPPTDAEPDEPVINAIKLQGLNKVTAKISTLEPLLGTVERFGNLEIIAHRCWKSPPEEQPENAALLEIREVKLNESPVTIFQGWMFSSSPAISALENPVYDITVLACEHKEGE